MKNATGRRPAPPMPPSLAAKPEWASYWQRMLRIMENPDTDDGPPEMVCDVCGISDATVYCPADRAHFCDACDASHHSVSALLLRHTRVPLCHSPFQFGECPEHPPELIESVCLDCAKLMCNHCILLADHPPDHNLISTIDAFRASPPLQPSDSLPQQLVETLEILHKRMLAVRANFTEVRDSLDKHVEELLHRSTQIRRQRTEVLESIRREVNVQVECESKHLPSKVLSNLMFLEWTAAFHLHQRICLPMGDYLVARANYEKGREFLVPFILEGASYEPEIARKWLEARLPATVTAPVSPHGPSLVDDQVTAPITVGGTIDVIPAAVSDRLGPRSEMMPGGFDAARPPSVTGDGGILVAHPPRQHDVIYASKKSDKLRLSSQASSASEAPSSSEGSKLAARPSIPPRPKGSTLRELMLASSDFVEEVGKSTIGLESGQQSYPMSSR
ncbi:hypothetical protein FOL47_007623 [Perkinsus chesapeaki]|uniref:B box-type domain-containing protein n=1 Tax=Perkinsus chesapeaki TaxID=330153 RepID=A0A7J6LJX3_PERCH|nr:hypothetical protein FOL47_007623 [Perkinsus chesapeaki]